MLHFYIFHLKLYLNLIFKIILKHLHIFHNSLIKKLNFYIHFIILLLMINILDLFDAQPTFIHLIINEFLNGISRKKNNLLF